MLGKLIRHSRRCTFCCFTKPIPDAIREWQVGPNWKHCIATDVRSKASQEDDGIGLSDPPSFRGDSITGTRGTMPILQLVGNKRRP